MTDRPTVSDLLGEEGLAALRRFISKDKPGMSEVEAVAYLVRDALVGLGELPLGERDRGKGARRG